MLPSKLTKRAATIAGSAALAMIATAAQASPASGVVFTNLTTPPNHAEFLDPDHMNSDRIKFQTKDETIVRIQSAVWEADSTSGWHHHPGVIMGVVTSGTITVWGPDCSQKTYGPGLPLGAVFLEGDNELMQATSSGGATEYVVHTVPWGSPPVFRVEDDPPACATAPAVRTVPKSR